MDIVITLLLLGLVAWAVKRFLDARRPEPPEDEWVLPPEEPDAVPRPGKPTATVMGPQVLDRESLVNPDRTLDPSKWDDSPDYLSGTDVDEP